MRIVTIDNWSISSKGHSLYQPPECRRLQLVGTAKDHLNPHVNGNNVRTSDIIGWDSNITAVVTQSGSRYILGDVDPEYEKAYPNARETFVKSLLDQTEYTGYTDEDYMKRYEEIKNANA